MAADATRELIKEKFNPFTKLPWIDFNRGDTEVELPIFLLSRKQIHIILLRHGYD